jgi:hypothetical protein
MERHDKSQMVRRNSENGEEVEGEIKERVNRISDRGITGIQRSKYESLD